MSAHISAKQNSGETQTSRSSDEIKAIFGGNLGDIQAIFKRGLGEIQARFRRDLGESQG